MNKITDYKISGRDLTIFGDDFVKHITFFKELGQALIFDDLLVIRLLVTPELKCIQNVFGVSAEGKIIWQIEALPSDGGSSYLGWDPCTGMGKEGDNVKLSKYRGIDLLVDPRTGKILEKGYSK